VESFDLFLTDRLPRLLAERLPVSGYSVDSTSRYTCDVKVTVSPSSGDLEVEYKGIPQPDEQGVFQLDGNFRVVVPIASCEELDAAEIRCVSEQLYDYVDDHLGEAPTDLPWDDALLRAYLPLDIWIKEFIAGTPDDKWLLNTELAGPTDSPQEDHESRSQEAHHAESVWPHVPV